MKAMGRRSVAAGLATLLNVAWYGVAGILALTLVLIAVGANVALHVDAEGPSVDAGPRAAMSIPVSLTLDPAANHVAAPSLGVDNAELQALHGALRFQPRRGPLFAAMFVIVIGSLLLLLWVLDQLRGLFRTLRDGRPFAPANATRVRRIAWAIIVGELARSAIVFFENYYAMTHFSAAGLTFEARPHLNGFALINGVIILVIAEVFREGTRLDEDRSLTI